MKAIAAMSENRALGKDGKLPWPNIKEDFKWFKEFTMGQILIVGRKTFEALPPLKNRNLIVFVRGSLEYYDDEGSYCPIYNTGHCYRNFPRILEISKYQHHNMVVIGGAKTYELFMPHITEFYVTHVTGIYDADVFMPPFENLFLNQEVIKEFDGHRVIRYSNRRVL